MLSLRFLAVCGAAVAVLSVAVLPEQAQARPQYRAAFGKKYPDLKEVEAEKKCGVCHPKGNDKKVINNYGMALKKALTKDDVEAKNVKDVKVLEEAMTAVEKTESATPKAEGGKEMKTFGELIQEGKLPGTDEAAEEKKE